MSVVQILATIECEGCGKQFRVQMDPARTFKSVPDWSLHDLAKDTVRGGAVDSYVGQKRSGWDLLGGSCSVQDDKMLCIECTAEADANAEYAEPRS